MAQNPFIAFGFCLIAGIASAQEDSSIRFYSLAVDNSIAKPDSFKAQERSVWCWAACTEMSLRLQGVEVNQSDVVTRVRGIPIETPGTPGDVEKALTFTGRDRQKALFSSTAEVTQTMSPLTLAFELGQGNPIICFYNEGAEIGHVVLIIGVSIDTRTGDIVHVRVADPWPLNERGIPVTDGQAQIKDWDGPRFARAVQFLVMPIVVSDSNKAAFEKTMEQRAQFAKLMERARRSDAPLTRVFAQINTAKKASEMVFSSREKLKDQLKVESPATRKANPKK